MKKKVVIIPTRDEAKAELAKAKDILERAQTEFERRTAEGYTPYEGATIAPFTAQEEAAQEGIQALV